jgi:hypothetical protein
MSDFAHLDPKPEFEADEPVIRDESVYNEVSPSQTPARTKKDALFSSPEAMNFEKGTIAEFDNVNIVRSQCSDDVLPDVDSYFPSSEQSVPLPELNDHEYR